MLGVSMSAPPESSEFDSDDSDAWGDWKGATNEAVINNIAGRATAAGLTASQGGGGLAQEESRDSPKTKRQDEEADQKGVDHHIE